MDPLIRDVCGSLMFQFAEDVMLDAGTAFSVSCIKHEHPASTSEQAVSSEHATPSAISLLIISLVWKCKNTPHDISLTNDTQPCTAWLRPLVLDCRHVDVVSCSEVYKNRTEQESNKTFGAVESH